MMTGACSSITSASRSRRTIRATRRSATISTIGVAAIEIATGDLTQPASLQAAVTGCEALFHVAADYRLGAPDPARLYATNVEGTRALLRAAQGAGVGRIVYTSSVATIGIPADGTPGDELSPVSLAAMVGHYKRSKFLAEQVVCEAARAGAPVVIVNPSTPVGPGDVKPTPTGRLVRDAAAGSMPAYVDTGLNIVHVDDVAAGHLLAFHRGRVGERYILGGEDMTLRQILTYIAALVGRRPPRVRLPYAAILPVAYVAEAVAKITGRSGRLTLEGVRMSKKHMFFSSGKAVRELGYRWRPPTEGFDDAVRWFREHGRLA